MKKIVTLIALIAQFSVLYSQIITNTGAQIIVENNTNLIFNTLHNSGAGAYFYYDAQIDLPGDWINTAPADFGQGANGGVVLNGTTQQVVRSGGADFVKLYVNNTSGLDDAILLDDNLEISDSLSLWNGIISTGSNTLIFADGSKSLIGNAGSFVDGKMQKHGNTSFTFPSGDIKSQDFDGNGNVTYQVWSPMAMLPESSSIVDVEYFFDDSGMPDWWEHGGNMDATLHHVSNREYWYVNSDHNLTTVTLYWNENSHAVNDICVHGFDYGDPSDFVMSDLAVAYWSGTLWRNAGGTGSGTHDDGYITSDLTVPFGAKAPTYITYGSKNDLNPLPVELVSLDADCYGKTVELVWQTATEMNNSGFFIERSEDALTFENVGFVRGAGNSNVPVAYSFSDSNPYKANNYYRLVQVDFDGKKTISNIVKTSCDAIESEEPEFIVYPNPSDDIVNAVAVNIPGDIAIVSVYNMLGSLITQQKTNVNAGSAFVVFELGNLPPAMYMVKIVADDYSAVKKVEIK